MTDTDVMGRPIALSRLPFNALQFILMPRIISRESVLALAVMLGLLTACPVWSDCPPDNLDAKGDKIESRIDYGLDTSTLTEKEARIYRKKVEKILNRAHSCRLNLCLGSQEIIHLSEELDHISLSVTRKIRKRLAEVAKGNDVVRSVASQ